MHIRNRLDENIKRLTARINMNQLSWINLNICVGVTVLYFLFMFASRIMRVEQISPKWCAFAGRALMAPFAFVFMFGLFWYSFYRKRKQGARLFAFLTSINMGIVGIVMLINADLMDKGLDWKEFMFFAYIGVSHLLFSIFGKEQNSKHEHIFIMKEKNNIDRDDGDWWKKTRGRGF